MRMNIPCQININDILNNIAKHQDKHNINELSLKNKPIMLNGQPIGVIKDKDNSFLWLDITPELQLINNEWQICGLNINTKSNEELFKLEYESKW